MVGLLLVDGFCSFCYNTDCCHDDANQGIDDAEEALAVGTVSRYPHCPSISLIVAWIHT
jgi:hypothetical protein